LYRMDIVAVEDKMEIVWHRVALKVTFAF